MKLEKYEQNPILSPNKQNKWENLVVCNPGVWYEDGKFHMLYRAAGDDEEHYIHIGLAVSEDGFNFERVSDAPVLSPDKNSFDAGCCEDPRIVKIDGEFIITYAFRPYHAGQYWKYSYDEVKVPVEHGLGAPRCLRENIANTALAISKDLKTFTKVGRLTDPNLDDRDVIIFPEKIDGKFWMLHRPKQWVGEEYGTSHPAIWIKSSDDVFSWPDESKLLLKGEEEWEIKVGGNAPPLKTEDGWLVIYHGVDENKTYRLGAVLLDLEDPTKILYRCKDFIMEPETEHEMNGLYKWGCVFPCGNVIVDGKLFLYYGASDQYINVATCKIDELISFIKHNSRVKKQVLIN